MIKYNKFDHSDELLGESLSTSKKLDDEHTLTKANKNYVMFTKENLNNMKIDMTTFLNNAIENRIINLSYFKTSKYWFEVDNIKDKKVAEKYL